MDNGAAPRRAARVTSHEEHAPSRRTNQETDDVTDEKKQADEFLEAGQGENQSIVGEFFSFMGENKKWWLTPFLIVFGLLGVLLALGATGAAPFIYTLF
jgi:hypothetical protein